MPDTPSFLQISETKSAAFDDVSLCKVKVKRTRSRSKSREDRTRPQQTTTKQQYVVNGKTNTVVLEFTQKNSGNVVKSTRNGRNRGGATANYVHRGAGKKQLGNKMGMSEFKNQVHQVKATRNVVVEPEENADDDVDDDLAQEINALRQIYHDGDVGSDENLGEEDGPNEDDLDKDTNWFKMDVKSGNDYEAILKSVKCNAYTTQNCNDNIECKPEDTLKCGDENIVFENLEEEVVEEVGEDRLGAENYNQEERDIEDELREMAEYRAQQEQMDRLEEQEMARIQREEDEMLRAQNEQDFLSREQMEMQEMQMLQQEQDDHAREQMEMQKQKEEAERREVQEQQNQNQNKSLEENQSNTGEDGKQRDNEYDNSSGFGNLFGRLIGGDNSAFEEMKVKAIKQLSQMKAMKNSMACGETMEVLDFFDCSDNIAEERKVVDLMRPAMRPANNHQECPPTALYAAIGTQSWNVALRRLLEKPDEASVWVKNASTDGETIFRFLPLHIACLSEAPLLLITLLVQAYPNAVKYTAMGKLPVHMACEVLADHRIVFLLLNAWPESINIRDDDENTPIEVASLWEPCEERKKIVQVLTKRMENSVVKTPTALYSAIDSQNWNYAILRLVEMPQEATTWVSFRKKKLEVRFLPLHIACLLGAPFFLISDLVQAYPDAVRKKTTQGKLPLHIACESHGDERVVELLLDSWQEGLFIKDGDGNTPLEVASATVFSPERTAILALLEEKLEHEDKIVYAPTKLYSLIEASDWDVAVRHCLESPNEVSMWVGSCQKIEDAKLLPLHIACSLRAPLILVAVLIQSYTESVKRTTNTGKLPIHLACEKRADHRIISLLLHTWPESYAEKDERGNTPVQTALLSPPSAERTKIVETLMAYEAKSEQDMLLVTNPVIDVERKARDLVRQSQPEPAEEPEREEVTKNSRKKESKRSWRSKGKKNQNVWGADAEMFAR